jgi:hypothetical protein
MKKFSMIVLAVTLTTFGVAASASAQGAKPTHGCSVQEQRSMGGCYGGHKKPTVAPGRSVIYKPTTVGIYATKFCANTPITITLSKKGSTVTRRTTTNSAGKAVVWVNTRKLTVGNYKIVANQPACGKYAQSHLMYKKGQANLGSYSGSSIVEAFSDLYSGMDSRSAAVTGSGSSSGGLPVTQMTLVGLLGAGGVAAVARRRTQTAA